MIMMGDSLTKNILPTMSDLPNFKKPAIKPGPA